MKRKNVFSCSRSSYGFKSKSIWKSTHVYVCMRVNRAYLDECHKRNVRYLRYIEHGHSTTGYNCMNNTRGIRTQRESSERTFTMPHHTRPCPPHPMGKRQLESTAYDLKCYKERRKLISFDLSIDRPNTKRRSLSFYSKIWWCENGARAGYYFFPGYPIMPYGAAWDNGGNERLEF